ncbi:MAG: DUF2282 domain-containing protein [Tatlockia sp.]|nr:DUF2282 domain-containing protein [Tatlockia sp.]
MNAKQKLINSAISAFLALATTNAAQATTTDSTQQSTEKCYGIVKAGMNDCSTSTSSCSGSAKSDRQADAFVFLPKGLCEKISGSSLTSGKLK